MKLLQINSVYDSGSTGRSCKEIGKEIVDAGGQNVIAYGYGKKVNAPDAYKIGTQFEYRLSGVLGRLTGLNGYFGAFATYRLVRFIKKYDPDVIHMNNLHGFYINLPILFSYLKKSGKPVVLTVHDCWIFTGKCTHYTVNGCYKWRTACDGSCPKSVVRQYPTSWFFNWSKKMFRDKKKWLTALPDLTVVGVSDWIANQARQSFLKDKRVLRIYNWIDLDVFKPQPQSVLADYGLNPDGFTVICVGMGWDGLSKNEQLKELVSLCGEDVQFLVVGKCNDRIAQKNVAYAGYVSGKENLAKLYSSADVYVHLSLEDTFGKVIAEALACGTPAVVFNSTACPEIVDEKTGAIVPPLDIEAMKERVFSIKALPKKSMAAACRARVEENFAYEKNIAEQINLYRNIIHEQ